MITIGIITNSIFDNAHLNAMVDTIECRDDVEVLIVGGDPLSDLAQQAYEGTFLRHISFDETQTPKAWITRKKNLITQNATYDTIVYAHDYFLFSSNWLDSFKSFIDTVPFDVATCRILTAEGKRHSDWVVDPFLLWKEFPELNGTCWNVLLPYHVNYTPIQYISGNFWVAKKQFMLDNPLDESLLWGDAEDIEWSSRIRSHTTFQCNMFTDVTIQKTGKWAPETIAPEHLATLKLRYNL